MAVEEEFSSVQVLYQLSWDGKLDHRHMIQVQYPSHQGGLRLRDVKKRLTTMRGQGISHAYSWSYKRNYKSTFIWNDLSDDDVIHPLRGSGEYVLKASALIDDFASKPSEHNLGKYPNERKLQSSQVSRGCSIVDHDNVTRHSRAMPVDSGAALQPAGVLDEDHAHNSAAALALGADRMSSSAGSKPGDLKEDAPKSGVSIDIPQNLPALSVEQETIDVEKSDFCCLSSSDNEISPRLQTSAACKIAPVVIVECKPAVKDDVVSPPVGLRVAMPRSPSVPGTLQTPPNSSLTSSTDPPLFSPGGTRRLWKREIRKSLFRTRNASESSSGAPGTVHHEAASPAIVEISRPREQDTHAATSFWRDGRLRSASTSGLNEMSKDIAHIMKEKEKEKNQSKVEVVEQSTSQMLRLIWARWTGHGGSGSKSSKRAGSREPSSPHIQLPLQADPVLERRSTGGRSHGRQSGAPESKTGSDSFDRRGIPAPAQEVEHVAQHRAIPKALSFTESLGADLLPNQNSGVIKTVVLNAPSSQAQYSPDQPDPQEESMTDSVTKSAPATSLQVVLDSPTSDAQCGPPEAEIDTPRPAIARVLVKSVKNSCNDLPRVKTSSSSGKPLPPGFHKGTNDTKPVQITTTPRRSFRSSNIPLASPPLMRSLSKDAMRSLSWNHVGPITTTTGSSEKSDSVVVLSTPSPEKSIDKKCINFRERDERPLTPGLTTLDWEKALQEAVTDCLPPPDFSQILQECSTCGRTFKPESLQVHIRGCHPPQYARAFSLRASPHMIRSRAL